ncbi:MAG: hypothetical protein KDI56_09290, partial [Xanthomonadales bacterium]|nr:hypothetical protein [Xanthomonadales bacterium]
MRWLRRLSAWLGGAMLAAVLGSSVQTQFNLAELQALGASIDLSTRWSATLHDLSGFTPAWWGLLVAGFALALPMAAWLSQRHGLRDEWYAL